MGTSSAPGQRFDQAYYQRFYEDPSTRVSAPEDTARLVRFVLAYLAFLRLRPRQALDLGCGLGRWRDALATQAPQLAYQGVELSSYLCETHGWEPGSVVDWAGPPADLVICQGVLQYLSDRDAHRAIENLGRLCRGALYLEALTQGDWSSAADREVTDPAVHLRSLRWYVQRLSPHFVSVGGGLFLARSAGVVLFELEQVQL